jgi:glycosyltransferase involved in cell wall biosynthesis
LHAPSSAKSSGSLRHLLHTHGPASSAIGAPQRPAKTGLKLRGTCTRYIQLRATRCGGGDVGPRSATPAAVFARLQESMGNSSGGDPQISVVMPVYQAERYLEVAVKSILAQSFDDFELLALDDGSTDASPQILARLAARDDRIRVHVAQHAGLVQRLNDGLGLARGSYIARMDADDISHPERFERQIAYLEAHPECVAVGTAVDEIDPDGRPIGAMDIRPTHEEIDERMLHGDGGALVHATAMYRARALRSIGGYQAGLDGGEDMDLHLRLSEIGRLANLPDRLFLYRKNYRGVTHSRRSDVRSRQDAAIRKALIRRGLDPASAPERPPFVAEPSPDAIWAIWANRALVSQHRDTARHYALKAFCAAPQRHWKLPIRVWLGIQPLLWKRCRQRFQQWIGRPR